MFSEPLLIHHVVNMDAGYGRGIGGRRLGRDKGWEEKDILVGIRGIRGGSGRR